MKHIALIFRPNIDSDSIIKTLTANFEHQCCFYVLKYEEDESVCSVSSLRTASIPLAEKSGYKQDACSTNNVNDQDGRSTISGTENFSQAGSLRKICYKQDACSTDESYTTGEPKEKIKPDCILVFGGDGTILRSLHFAAGFHVPILGFNMGTLGFLTDCKVSELIPSLNMFIKGKYQIEKRMLLDITVIRNNERIVHLPALNDAVIYKGELSKLITLKLYSNKRYVYETRCDGIITATPTGSTAYSMSSGGPIISPDMEAFVVNPLNPHVLSIRPMIFNANDTLHFKLEEPHSSTVLQIDGVNVVQLLPKDKITIKCSNKKMGFIKLSHRTFYQILRKKLKMGKH